MFFWNYSKLFKNILYSISTSLLLIPLSVHFSYSDIGKWYTNYLSHKKNISFFNKTVHKSHVDIVMCQNITNSYRIYPSIFSQEKKIIKKKLRRKWMKNKMRWKKNDFFINMQNGAWVY